MRSPQPLEPSEPSLAQQKRTRTPCTWVPCVGPLWLVLYRRARGPLVAKAQKWLHIFLYIFYIVKWGRAGREEVEGAVQESHPFTERERAVSVR